MSDETDAIETAMQMMRQALVLLDAAGEHVAAIRLQHALDTTQAVPIVPSDR